MKKRMRMAAAVMAAVMGMMTLGGCGTASEKSETAAQAEGTDAKQTSEDGKSQDLKEINVVLDWYPNAIHTFIYTAIERGYYAEEGLDVKVRFPANANDALALVAAGKAEEGLDVKVRFPANANDALSLVAAGKAEIGMYYQQDVIQAVANQGTKIKSIGAIVQSPLSVVLSLKDKNITGPENLVGKTVGYGGTALSEAVVKSMMEYVGADASDVNLIDVGFELMSSMTTGNVDATIGCLVNHEVPQMEEEGFDVNYFMAAGYGIPNYYEEVFLANNEMIQQEPEVLEGFLRASKKGFEDFKNDPNGCLAILMNNQNEENFPLTQSVEEKSCETLLPLMESDEVPFLTQTEECWQENIDWMSESGLIDKKVDVSDVMVNLQE